MSNTYQPYAGDFGLGFLFGYGVDNGRSPLVADFNGDGNPDIAVWENPSTFYRQSYLQILLGNGDGTFTPSYNKAEFHQLRVPNNAADVNGGEHTWWNWMVSLVHLLSSQRPLDLCWNCNAV
jgi:hypothetical protein